MVVTLYSLANALVGDPYPVYCKMLITSRSLKLCWLDTFPATTTYFDRCTTVAELWNFRITQAATKPVFSTSIIFTIVFIWFESDVCFNASNLNGRNWQGVAMHCRNDVTYKYTGNTLNHKKREKSKRVSIAVVCKSKLELRSPNAQNKRFFFFRYGLEVFHVFTPPDIT